MAVTASVKAYLVDDDAVDGLLADLLGPGDLPDGHGEVFDFLPGGTDGYPDLNGVTEAMLGDAGYFFSPSR